MIKRVHDNPSFVKVAVCDECGEGHLSFGQMASLF